MASKAPNLSLDSMAICMLLKTIIPSNIITNKDPIKPHSSAIAEKMKSDDFSGRKPISKLSPISQLKFKEKNR